MTDNPKKQIRRKAKEARDGLPKEFIKKHSEAIASNLFSLPEFKVAKNVMFYVSFGSEVETHSMIKDALACGKTVSVPITDIKNKCLHLSKVTDPEKELFPSTFGILEPKKEHISPVEKKGLDLIVSPGVAFDRHFNRMGYGGGFYDRLFAEIPGHTVKVALCFEMQLHDGLPVEITDRKLDILVTERCIYRRS